MAGRRLPISAPTVAIVLGTIVLAFGVNAVAHLILLLRRSRLVQEYRGTLQFLSAWVGDGVLLPALNVIAARLLQRTGGPPNRAELAAALAVGGGITAALHGYQGARGLVNWSMPRPWRWNLLGWYHALFMTGQLSYLALALLRLRRWRRTPLALRDGALIGAGLLLFALLLRWDYRSA
ncbi:MAG: hypothetical protein RMM58_10310 [Chloroflexota bacterium]|nr:hypothetical protein [Dehalococcoidia bacterium]MDW8254257.1 hypothetical protein [Chloroflexota bacterium]